MGRKKEENGLRWQLPVLGGVLGFLVLVAIVYAASSSSLTVLGAPIAYVRGAMASSTGAVTPPPTLDKNAYNIKLLALAHVPASSPWYNAFLDGTTTPMTAQGVATTTTTKKPL